jgi:hypothetical protein
VASLRVVVSCAEAWRTHGVSDPRAHAQPQALLAGALAGAMSRTFTSPLERLKVLRQVDTTDAYKGARVCVHSRACVHARAGERRPLTATAQGFSAP